MRSAIGSMCSVRMRVAHRHCWPSRRVSSVRWIVRRLPVRAVSAATVVGVDSACQPSVLELNGHAGAVTLERGIAPARAVRPARAARAWRHVAQRFGDGGGAGRRTPGAPSLVAAGKSTARQGSRQRRRGASRASTCARRISCRARRSRAELGISVARHAGDQRLFGNRPRKRGQHRRRADVLAHARAFVGEGVQLVPARGRRSAA